MGDIIYDTSFYNTLEAAVNDFRKALTKRWREETVKTIRYSNDYVTTAFRRTQAPYGEPSLWDYRDPINVYHLIYGGCEIVRWYDDGADADVPTSCPGNMQSAETA